MASRAKCERTRADHAHLEGKTAQNPGSDAVWAAEWSKNGDLPARECERQRAKHTHLEYAIARVHEATRPDASMS